MLRAMSDTKPMFSVVHATKRPKLALEQMHRWLAAADKSSEVEWIFGVDPTDAATRSVLWPEPRALVAIGGADGPLPAFNAAANASRGHILIAASDDIYPLPHWDSILKERLAMHVGYVPNGSAGAEAGQALSRGEEERLAHYLKMAVTQKLAVFVSDGHRSDGLVTLQIATRPWLDGGFFFPSELKRLYADNWFMKRALREHCYVECRDLVFEHKHPFFSSPELGGCQGMHEWDEVYATQNSTTSYTEDKQALDKLLPPITISLCLIAGNEAALIIRLLNSAFNAFDELCLVVATGTEMPDQTLYMAEAWCEKHGKKFRSAYYDNTIPNLPHVDDFAAARNLSFSLATCDWQLWLDCDDLLTAADCAGIRECAEEGKADAYCFSYTKAVGGTCPRERLIRRGAGKWRGRIHETCEVASGDVVVDETIAVKHAPPAGKHKNSHERNTRLLEIALDQGPRHLFYLAQEYYHAAVKESLEEEVAPSPVPGNAGDRAASENRGPSEWSRPANPQGKYERLCLQIGRAALPLLDDKPEEKYEIYLNFSEIDPDRALEHLTAALLLQPWRREALAYLVQWAMAHGQLDHAVSWFRMMDNLPLPSPLPWTHRSVWYGWGRNYLRVKLLYARGQKEQADKEHAGFLQTDPDYAKRFAV